MKKYITPEVEIEFTDVELPMATSIDVIDDDTEADPEIPVGVKMQDAFEVW